MLMQPSSSPLRSASTMRFAALRAERGYLTLERADTRLCGVKVDKLGNGGIVYSQLLCRKTVARALLRDEMILCDSELFVARIAAQLYDLHTVEQRRGNSFERVCRRDKTQELRSIGSSTK